MSTAENAPTTADARIAIIGMAGRFPGAYDIDEFWQNLVDRTESMTELELGQLRAAGSSQSRIDNPRLVRLVPFMDEIEFFDAKYFGYNARQAQVTDPQQRIFLEVCHTALEHAGYAPGRYAGTIGVYGGGAPNTYAETYVHNNVKALAAVGDLGVEITNASDYLATRVSYTLGLTGPAVSVATACSTALVAVHLACQALRSGECDMALAGAVNVRVPYAKGYLWADGGIYSRDGHVRPFDAQASGTNFGYGAGAFVLKRLEAAIADGDTVQAVILGTAINNDGAGRTSFSAPGMEGQSAVVVRALHAAGGISPDSIGYVEAHGTGTAVGDPIEVSALSTAFRELGCTASQSIPIGSVKSNIGHLGAAAGVPGLIKTVLAMRQNTIPATLHYKQPNPQIDFAQTPFHVARRNRKWPKIDGPKRAGVSSFGIGGTNAHVILEEAPSARPGDVGRPWQVLPVSAHSPAALDQLSSRLGAYLREHPEIALADVAYTLANGRPELAYRGYAVCREEDCRGGVLPIAAGNQVHPGQPADVVFLFPGQGTQHPGMAREVYHAEPVFREALDACAELALPRLGQDLRALLFDFDDRDAAAERLRRTEFAQPALFMVEYALARLWLSWGVEPAAMIGHSIGEIVAACLAGVFSLGAAVEFVVARGRLTQSMPSGSMLAIPMAEADVAPLLTDRVSLAAANAPRSTVVAGPSDAIRALADQLQRVGVESTPLRTSHAFHSAMLDPILNPLRSAAEDAGLKVPASRFISTVTGDWINPEQATDPGYWAAQVRQPVQFARALQTAASSGAVLLEVGPGRALTSLARQSLGKTAITVPSLTPPGRESAGGDEEALAQAIGQIWVAGAGLDWSALSRGQRRLRVPLPTYPYQRERHWLAHEPADQDGSAMRAEEPEAAAQAEPGILYRSVWRARRLPSDADAVASGPLLALTLGSGPVETAAREWERRGHAVVRVLAGDDFEDLGGGAFRISPARRADYESLIRSLDQTIGRPVTVLHGWTATRPSAAPFDPAEADRVRDMGFYSLLYLVQALTTRWPDDQFTVRTITTNSADVSGTEAIEPAKALLQGPVKVVPIETNQVACQLIDLSEASGADQLLSELVVPVTDTVIAYRGGRRWVHEYEPVPPLPGPIAMPRVLRRRGVYLITGGLGDIGLKVARELVLAANARLVLIGRTPLPDRSEWDAYPGQPDDGGNGKIAVAIRGVRELEGLGAEVVTCAADVADEAAMAEIITVARDRFGRIDGVFHAAGVAGAGLVAMKSREQAEKVLRAKVDGTLVLDRLLGDGIELFVLFSSIFAASGGYGQVDYCAGNAFLDAFAQARSPGSVQVLSVDWCGWSGVGMVADDIREPTASAGKSEQAAPRERVQAQEPAEGGVSESTAITGLLGRRAAGADDVTYSVFIGPDWHWVLTDHQMAGRPVFPGTSYAEMIAAAARAEFGGAAVELRDLIFGRPVPIDGPRELRVTGVRQGPETYQFTVTSRPLDVAEAAWERHASASAGVYHDGEAPKRDLAAIAARCDIMSWKPELTDDPGNVVVFGPHWQVVRTVGLGTGEQLAELVLPPGLEGDAGHYCLHPSLLDGATALSLYIPEVVQGDSSYLPIAYDRLIVRDSLPIRFHSHVRNRGGASGSGIMSFDLALIDDEGRERVTIEGFSVRVVNVTEIHSGLDTTAPESARRSASQLGLARDEILIEPELGLDLLWRMLDARDEVQYVVSAEPLEARTRRLSQIAGQVAAVLGSGKGSFARTAAVRSATGPVTDSESMTSTEQMLRPLWEDAFAVSWLGLDEDFFDLGGNSLVAVQLAVRIREQFGINVPGVAVLEYPTIRAQASYIDGALAEEARS